MYYTSLRVNRFNSMMPKLFYTILGVVCILGATGNLEAQWVRVSPRSIGIDGDCLLSYADRLLVTTDSDVFVTSNDGLSWYPSGLRQLGGDGPSLAQMGGDIFSGGGVGVFRSGDSGVSWERTPGGPDDILDLTVLGERIFATSSKGGGAQYLDDTGNKWVNFNFGPNIYGSIHIQLFVVDSILFVSGLSLVQGGSGVIRSSDGGSSWQQVLQQSDGGMTDLTSLGSTFVICNRQGIYLSNDSGLSWNKVTGISEPLIFDGDTLQSFNAFASFGSDLFVSGDSGVYLTTDTGKSWRPENEGLPDSEISNVQPLAIHGGYLFAGTSGAGVWRRPLSDFNQSGVAASAAGNSGSTLRVFPNPASGELQITGIASIGNDAAGEVHLFDLLGREVITPFALPAGSGVLDVSHLEPGLYSLRLGTQSAKVEIVR